MMRSLKNALFALGFTGMAFVARAQIVDTTRSTGIVHETSQVKPMFPGGNKALGEFLIKNVRFPAEYQGRNLGGMVVAQFVVTPKGTLSDLEIIMPVKDAPLFSEEVLRVIHLMPKWIPGTIHGEAVSVQYRLPIDFTESK